MRPRNLVKIEWSPRFAYAIGLLATDGCLYSDGRHIELTSNDKDQVLAFRQILKLKNKIGIKKSGTSNTPAFRIQFGDINFHKFLSNIGISPKKSKNLNRINVPDEFFFDFLRGHFDGDGTFYSYMDKRWRSSFMFYLYLISASKEHVLWLQEKIFQNLKIKGHISKSKNQNIYSLRFAKADTLKLLSKMYYSSQVVCLERKRLKIQKALSIIGYAV